MISSETITWNQEKSSSTMSWTKQTKSAHFWWTTAHTRRDHSMQKGLRDSMRRTVLIAYMSVISMSQSHTHLTSHEWTLNSLCSRPLVRWYTRTEPLLVPIETTEETRANLAGESFPPKSFVKFTFYKRIQTTHLKNKWTGRKIYFLWYQNGV